MPSLAEPGPGRPPGQPRVLTDDAGRDRLLALLREHYARGTIDDAELERRSEIALTARFADEAAAAVAALPVLGGAGPVRPSRRRHAQSAQPGAGWVPTAERFRDPTSQAIIRVWIDPADDSRHYVPEPNL